MRTALALAALVLAGCTATSQSKAPDALDTRAVTATLKDALIQTAVKTALVSHEPDAAVAVDVAVRDGVVTLTGVVKSGTIRRELVELSRETPEVRRVVDGMRVDSRRRRIEDQAGDVALATRVEAALEAELGPQPVTVRVESGVATLDGTVRDAKTKAAIVRTARDTTGIRNVVDRIRVAGP